MASGTVGLGLKSSPFQDLVWLSHGLTIATSKYLAMFVGYFDDGGHTSDQPVVSVGCVVARASAWEEFNEKWSSSVLTN